MADTQRNQAEKTESSHSNITMENVHVGGSITGSMIVGHHNVVGFNSEQVAALIAQISSTFTPKPFTGTCPYKGLDPFDEEDAGLFFGREKLVEELVSRVKASRTVFVTGPSGSGKSSLVRAGLLCALKQGAVKDSAAWVYARMKPGRDPLQALARAVSAAVHSTNAEDEILSKAPTDRSVFARWCEIALQEGQGKRFVLFIDQFEEVFTQVGRDDQRAVFLNLLTHAANVEGGRAIILFTMRSDFVANCAAHPELNQFLNRQFIQIGAMQADELVNAIAQPALRTGLRIDPDLIAQIINDMDGEPGSLPLMQFALKDLFDAQQAKGGLVALSLEEYLTRGGIHKALERHADQTFAGFGQEEQELARVIFTGLIEIGRGTQDTRRTASFRELVPASSNPADVQDVVARLADARLVTTDDQIVTLAHERLIDAWPWLKRLVNENRDLIALQNEIAEDAREWDEHKREPSYLYAGGRLANTLEQIQSKKITLGVISRDFIKVGLGIQKRRRATLVLSVLLVMSSLVAATLIFSRQSQANERLATKNIEIANTAQAASTQAVQQSKVSRAGLSSSYAEQYLTTKPDLSLLLSVEAMQSFDNDRTQSTMIRSLQQTPYLTGYLPLEGYATALALSNDGSFLVVNECLSAITHACHKNKLNVYETASRKLIHSLEMAYPARHIAISPDNRLIAFFEYRFASRSQVVIYSLIENKPAYSFEMDMYSADSSMFFSLDNRYLVMNDGSFFSFLELQTNKHAYWIDFVSGGSIDAAISPDLKTEVVEPRFTDPQEGNLNRESFDNTAIHIIRHGKEVVLPLPEYAYIPLDSTYFSDYDTEPYIFNFSPDGTYLSAVDAQGHIFVWNLQSLKMVAENRADLSGSTSTIFMKDTTGMEKTSYFVDSQGEFGAITSSFTDKGQCAFHLDFMHTKTIVPLYYTQNLPSSSYIDCEIVKSGNLVAYPVGERLIALLHLKSHKVPENPTQENMDGSMNWKFHEIHMPEAADALAVNSQNGLFAILADASRILIYDPRQKKVIKSFPARLEAPDAVGTFSRFDIDTWKSRGQKYPLAFSLDGTRLAFLSQPNLDAEITIWDTVNYSQVLTISLKKQFNDQNELIGVQFLEHDVVLAVSGTQTSYFFDAQTGKLLRTIHVSQSELVESHQLFSTVAFHPEKPQLAGIIGTGYSGPGLAIFNTNVDKPVKIIPKDGISIYGASYNEDGNLFAAGGEQGIIMVWETSTWRQVAEFHVGDLARVDSIEFRDTDHLIVISTDYAYFNSTLTLWNVATQQIIGSFRLGEYCTSIAANQDGYIAVGCNHGLKILNLSSSALMEQACQAAGRNMTRGEWDSIYPFEEYRATCPQWTLEAKNNPTP